MTRYILLLCGNNRRVALSSIPLTFIAVDAPNLQAAQASVPCYSVMIKALPGLSK